MPRTYSLAQCFATSLAKSTPAFLALALGAATLTTACGAPAARPGTAALALAPTAGGADVTRSGSHVMTAADFGRVADAPNALVAIERVRPLFLRPRPSFGSLRGQTPVVSVFINGAYAGGVDALRLINPDAVSSAR